ncbi:MAG: hypothetical protein KGY78_11535 [Anaerolineae bacterium]|nr:hypothetical protein [Anaerolineae bacterium]
MLSRISAARVMITVGMILLLMAIFVGLASVGPSAVRAGVTPTVPSPVETPTIVQPTDTPVDPTDTPVDPTDTPVDPTDTPVDPTDTPVYPTPTPVYVPPTPVPGVFKPAPPTGVAHSVGLPLAMSLGGLGLVLIGLGLVWRRRR